MRIKHCIYVDPVLCSMNCSIPSQRSTRHCRNFCVIFSLHRMEMKRRSESCYPSLMLPKKSYYVILYVLATNVKRYISGTCRCIGFSFSFRSPSSLLQPLSSFLFCSLLRWQTFYYNLYFPLGSGMIRRL